MSDQVQHELKRSHRFEPATITTANADGTVDSNTAERTSQRTRAFRATSQKFRNGDRAIMLSARDNDQPILLGQNPWICD